MKLPPASKPSAAAAVLAAARTLEAFGVEITPSELASLLTRRAELSAPPPAAPPPPKLLAPAAFAALAGVSTRSVHRWLAAGRLQSVRLGLRSVRIPQSQLAAVPTAGEGC